MRWTRTILTGAAVAGGTALVAVGLAHAQGHGGWGPRHGRGMIVLIEQFDLDKDGKLTQAEIDQARKDQFAKYDTDQNGSSACRSTRPCGSTRCAGPWCASSRRTTPTATPRSPSGVHRPL